MAVITRIIIVAILAIVYTNATTEDNILPPAKIAKDLPYPKKYQPMSLKKFRPLVPTTTETPSTSTTGTPTTQEPNTTPNPAGDSETVVEEASRKRKSATTTFCVEIRPSNPYQKPFQVCEPNVPEYASVPQPHVYRPVQYVRPVVRPHAVVPQKYQVVSQLSYGGHAAPSYEVPAQQHYAVVPEQSSNAAAPQQPIYAAAAPVPEKPRPVMVVPHVPVAEPYHVPSAPQHHHAPGPYRMNMMSDGDEIAIALEDDAWLQDGNQRTAYDDSYESHEKTPIYDYHKKKEISYLPIITKKYKKTKPLKFLKVLKDLKKDKYKIGYEEPEYEYKHESGGYKHGYGGGGKQGGGHGLVITCQPSAVGYTGSQVTATDGGKSMELLKEMELMKHIYAAASRPSYDSMADKQMEAVWPMIKKLYTEQQHQPQYGGQRPMSGGGGNSEGYVPPGTYRSAGGWSNVEQAASANEQEANLAATLAATQETVRSSNPTAQSMQSTSASMRKAAADSFALQQNKQPLM